MSLSGFFNMVRVRDVRVLLALIFLLLWTSGAPGDPPSGEVSKMFPVSLGGFHRIEPVLQIVPSDKPKQILPILIAKTEYASADGEKLLMNVTKYESDSAAYSGLTAWHNYESEHGGASDMQVGSIGTANATIYRGLAFFKGPIFVVLTTENLKHSDQVTALARLFSATLDSGGGDIPVLVKHLPDWEKTYSHALYAVSVGSLKEVAGAQPVFNALNFDGGTEAVTANYGQSQLVIVEFTTPQFASDNDRRIVAKIQELKNQDQTVPNGYRRVGNYSVFVFNASDEKTANELIDQVKYEQVVQWLGDDPHLYERIQRYFLQKTSGVVIAVLESSGLSVLLCLGVGGLFGALLFRRRRARQQGTEAYSDAGGMVRLNLDDATEGSDPSCLLQGSNKHG